MLHENTKLAIEWLRESAVDAVANDPSVGIFPNQDLAYELLRAAAFLEEGRVAATAQSEARITELKAELRRVYAEIRQPIAVSYSDFLSSAPDWARTLAEG